MKTLMEHDQAQQFKELMKKYVKAQVEAILQPSVTQDTLHLRTLLTIFYLLRYPRDCWYSDKDLIRQRI